jgi:hypothetical protein
MRDHYLLSAKEICNAVLERAVRMDDHIRDTGEEDRIDDKTVFIIKRSETGHRNEPRSAQSPPS